MPSSADKPITASLPIGELFAEMRLAFPERVALRESAGELSYAELDVRSNQLAHRLVGLGVTAGSVVAVPAARSVPTIVSLLAILKAGGAYLALDPRMPASRQRELLVDAGVRVLLASHPGAVPAGSGETVLSWSDAAEQRVIGEQSAGPVTRPVRADDIAYLAYTSGSSGKPKGVLVPHRAVQRLVRDPDYFSPTPQDVFLQYAPLAFDASTLEIWGPLLNGGRLFVPADRELTTSELGRLVQAEEITVLWLTAGLFHQLDEESLAAMRGLRYLLAGGDVLSVAQVNRVVAALPATTVVNGYGPTENTTFTCCHQVRSAVREGSVPIGQPIRGTAVRVLDSGLSTVSGGTPGELYAAGAGLARGYLNDPKLTAERFLPDPASDRPGARMYRTGDIVRAREDGALEFLGRADDQVKIRGFRIELGEVESAVQRVPGVADAAVVAQEHPEGGRSLAAFVVAQPGTEPSTLLMRQQLAEDLPRYAIPSSISVLGELPLTRNGKVDRKNLRGRRGLSRPEVDADYRGPEDDAETAMAVLWSDQLDIAGIGMDDDFFELGGHSLAAVRIISEIRRRYGVRLSPRDFYLNPSPAALLCIIREADQ
jgi:amino acid adenylation domain-containing protein